MALTKHKQMTRSRAHSLRIIYGFIIDFEKKNSEAFSVGIVQCNSNFEEAPSRANTQSHSKARMLSLLNLH